MAHLTTNKIFTPDIERISIQGSSPLIKVPFNKINLSNGDSVLVSTVEVIAPNRAVKGKRGATARIFLKLNF